MEIKLIKDIDECKRLWEELSPKKTIYDEWDFRYCFYKYFNYELYFYAGYENSQCVALFPLQYNSDKGYLEFFGGSYMDMNQVFTKSPDINIKTFYENLTLPANLIIIGEDEFTKSLPFDDYNYYFTISSVKTFKEFIENRFPPKTSRKKFIKRMEKMAQSEIFIIKDNFEDLDVLIELNTNQFQEESSFHFPHRKEIFQDLLKLPFQFGMLTLILNDEKIGVSLSILYKNIYYYLASGADIEKVSDLGNFITSQNVIEAISKNAEILDIGSGDCGWKEHWHAEKTSQYLLKRK